MSKTVTVSMPRQHGGRAPIRSTFFNLIAAACRRGMTGAMMGGTLLVMIVVLAVALNVGVLWLALKMARKASDLTAHK